MTTITSTLAATTPTSPTSASGMSSLSNSIFQRQLSSGEASSPSVKTQPKEHGTVRNEPSVTAENAAGADSCSHRFDSPGEKKFSTPPGYADGPFPASEIVNTGPFIALTRRNSGSLPDLRKASSSEQDTPTFDMSDTYGSFKETDKGVPEQAGPELGPSSGASSTMFTNGSTPPLYLNTDQATLYSATSHDMNLTLSKGLSPIAPSSMASSTSTVHSMELHAVQPLLYSAIGSLENRAAALPNKKTGPNKGVREFRASGPLIPPQKPSFNQSFDDTPVHENLKAKRKSTNKPRAASERLPSKTTTATTSAVTTKKSSLRRKNKGASVRIKDTLSSGSSGGSSKKKKDKLKKKRVTISKQKEEFCPVSEAYTPRQKKNIKFKTAEMRTPVQSISGTMGTLSRPNFRDALRRVAMIIRQHIVKIEHRFSSSVVDKTDLFDASMIDMFSDEHYVTPTYKCTMVRVPMARPSTVYGMRRIRLDFSIPTEEEIYEFGHQLFKSVQLSSECSIVCLIYVERLMEVAKVPLVASTWRPVFMCGLLLASKVWQDLASWNVEFASVYPQYSVDAINRMELQFLRMVKWDLYISSSLYAKYYFALRSLVEKQDFRQRYNRMVGGVGNVAASEALKVQQRTELVKEEALMQLSRSM